MKWLSNIPTSKKFAWVVVLSYIGEIIFTSYAMYAKQIDLTSILIYTTPLVTLVLTSYFVKSGAENVTTIKQSSGQDEGSV